MPFYQYYGRNKAGNRVKGKLKGHSEHEVREKLGRKNIVPVRVEKLEGLLYRDITLFNKGKLKDLVLFIRQLATLLKAGVSLVDSIHLLYEQTKNRVLKESLSDIEEKIRSGTPFSEAAEKHRHVFPPLFTNMIKAGEAGGNLDEVLERLADYYEKQYRTKQKVISAVSYPLVLAFVALAVVIFLLSVVVPSFADMFAGFGSDLPWITQFVLSTGTAVQNWFWLILLIIISAAVSVIMLRRDNKYRYYLDYALLKTPVFGQVLQKAALARISRTWSSLFASSVPVLQATSIVERIAGNEVLSRVIRESRHSLEKGESLTVPMESHWIFPPLVTQMVVVGEKTGSLDVMLAKVADFYEQEVDEAADRLKSMLEPALIVVLAVVVGVIVASIAVPMFEIFDTIG